MKQMLRFLRGYEKESVIAPLFKMLEAFFDLFVPLVMADIINTGIAAGDRGYILARCGLLVALGFIGLSCSLTAQYFAARAAVGYSTALRHTLFAHIQSLDHSAMDKLGASTLITRMTSDINQIQSGINMALRLFLRSPFIVVGSMVMAFTIDARAAVIFAVSILLLAAVVFGVMLLTRPLFRQVQQALDGVTGVTRENLSGVRVVRAFNKQQAEVDRFEAANGLLTALQQKAGSLSALMNPLTYVVVNLTIIAILYCGGRWVNDGVLLNGDIVALVSYMTQILVELVKLANTIVLTTKALACAGRVQAVLETQPGMAFPTEMPVCDASSPAVRFDRVSLQYTGAGDESLTDVSFEALPGQTIGVIGGTGSGKTSLVNLIPRFYDTTAGSVLLFGVPAHYWPREALRSMVGIVPQKAQLFSGTIRSNLLWGNPTANDAQLWAALEAAQAAEFVRAKPLGLDEVVEQGGRNLSGGQKQRLTIARALVRQPRILILDDSASALDFATDAALRKAIRALPGQMTVFIVSQRAASLMHADRILVLAGNKSIEEGSHRELLEQKGM